MCASHLPALRKLPTDAQQAAVTALNTLQSNFSIVDTIRKSGRGMNKNAIPEMIEWFQKAGYEVCGSPSTRLCRDQQLTFCSPPTLTS